MAELIMPKAGDAMTEGKVVKWYKQPGDAVKKGEPVAEIETDKVNLDLEAESDGTLGAHAAKEGDMVPVGGVLTRILGEGEKDVDEVPRSASASSEEKEQEQEQPAEEPRGTPRPSEEPSEQQRRSTDKKESVKHTTGEYHEAIEQRG